MIELEDKELFYKVWLEKLPSLNQMYLVGRSGNKVWTYLNPQVQKVKDEIIYQLRLQGIHKDFEDIDYTKALINIEVIFGLKESFWNRDTDNMFKYTLDAISSASNVDDSYNIRIKSEKAINDLKDNKEHILIRIELKYQRDLEIRKIGDILDENIQWKGTSK